MTTASNNVLQDVALGRTIPLSPKSLWRLECPTKVFFLSISPDEVVWLARVDVECILPCSSDPLGRDGDESEQKTLDSVCVMPPLRGLGYKLKVQHTFPSGLIFIGWTKLNFAAL